MTWKDSGYGLVEFFVIFETFARAYLFQIALEIIWLPTRISRNIPREFDLSWLIILINSLLELALHKAYRSSDKKEITLLYAIRGKGV